MTDLRQVAVDAYEKSCDGKTMDMRGVPTRLILEYWPLNWVVIDWLQRVHQPGAIRKAKDGEWPGDKQLLPTEAEGGLLARLLGLQVGDVMRVQARGHPRSPPFDSDAHLQRKDEPDPFYRVVVPDESAEENLDGVVHLSGACCPVLPA